MVETILLTTRQRAAHRNRE